MSTVDLTRFNEMPIAGHIGFHFVFARDGGSEVQLTVGPELGNAQGIGHGGILPVLIDAAGTLAIQSSFPEPERVRVLTADLRVNLIGTLAIGATVTARGSVTHLGERTCFAQVDVAAGGATVGLGQLTCVVRRVE